MSIIGLGVTEAESLDLSTYEVENRNNASGGELIRILAPAGTVGTASGMFSGPIGTYEIAVTYFNENDGVSTFEVLVNDAVVDTWQGIGGSGRAGNAEVETVTVDLATDDVVTLRGTVGGDELARFDAIDLTALNFAPVVASPVPDRTATDGNPFNFTLPSGTFSDADGDTLTLSAAQDDGSALPAWLTFNPSTGVFSGTPGPGDLGTITVRVTAEDGNASVFDDFDIVVGNPVVPPSMSTLGLGVTEAENLTLSVYDVESRSDASGGEAIRILTPTSGPGTEGTASGTFTGPAGTYDIAVTYFNENDGVGTYEVLLNGVVVGSWQGVGGSGRTGSPAVEVVTTDLETDDVITFRGTVGDGELARLDAINITQSTGTPVDPPVDPPVTGEIGVGLTEAENLTLSVYDVESRSDASGGEAIRILTPTSGDGTQGTAAGTFTGDSDTYDIAVTYFNESDGIATYEILINDVVAYSWQGIGGSGRTGSPEVEMVTLDLATNDVIKLRGTVGDGELARLDAINITQSSGTPIDPPVDPPVTGEIGVGVTEAENLTLSVYDVESRSDASGGEAIRILTPTSGDGTQGTASGMFTGASGTYDIAVTYFNENDGIATYEILINDVVAYSWQGIGGSGRTGSPEVEMVTLDLAMDDVITFRGTVGDGELARLDAIEITSSTGTPVDPPVMGDIGIGTTEAETLDLVTYEIADVDFASGGQVIQIFNVDGTQGTATGEFTGPAGNYDLSVTYLNESDGVGTFEVLVNDIVAFSWTGEGGGPGFGTPTVENGFVALETGDVITFRGTVGDGEAVRLDKIDVAPATASPFGVGTTEAESLALEAGYSVEDRNGASEGQVIRVDGPDGAQGTATGRFTGPSGNYDLEVTYFNENDGVGTYEILINDVVAYTWQGIGGVGRTGSPEVEMVTLDLETDDVITFRGTLNAGELARIDKFELTANEVAPDVATLGIGTTEAETLDLVTYEIADVDFASGGQVIQIFNVDGTQGTATGEFTGPAGNYDLSVTYLNESDGVGTFEVLVNDIVAFSWTGEGGGPGFGTPTVENGFAALETGDVITFRGTVGDGEAVRLDKIDILPQGPDAATLDLSATDTAYVVDLGNEFLSEAARLLLLGDSLTEGAAIDGGYRAPLFDLISHDLGLWVDFVGGRTTNPVDGLLDLDHQGTGGITATTVRGEINTIAATNPADFALVMLGTNDVLQESNPQSSVPGELLGIMQALDAANPSIEVLLAELPPTNFGGGGSEIPAINAALPGTISNAISLGVSASLVDFSNITLADYYDNLHPDEDGVVKFAENWLAGLQATASVSGGTFGGTETPLSMAITSVIGGSNNDRLTGDAAANNLHGAGGNDWIEGAGGNDILTGGFGTDLFVFKEDAGLDTITDFDLVNDLIDLRDHTGATNFGGLDITQSGSDVVIRVTGDDDADTITVTGVMAGALDADNFLFDDAFSI